MSSVTHAPILAAPLLIDTNAWMLLPPRLRRRRALVVRASLSPTPPHALPVYGPLSPPPRSLQYSAASADYYRTRIFPILDPPHSKLDRCCSS